MFGMLLGLLCEKKQVKNKDTIWQNFFISRNAHFVAIFFFSFQLPKMFWHLLLGIKQVYQFQFTSIRPHRPDVCTHQFKLLR